VDGGDVTGVVVGGSVTVVGGSVTVGEETVVTVDEACGPLTAGVGVDLEKGKMWATAATAK